MAGLRDAWGDSALGIQHPFNPLAGQGAFPQLSGREATGRVETWETSEGPGSELIHTTAAESPMAKASPMAKPKAKGPLEEPQSHTSRDVDTKGRWKPGAKIGIYSNGQPSTYSFSKVSWLFLLIYISHEI